MEKNRKIVISVILVVLVSTVGYVVATQPPDTEEALIGTWVATSIPDDDETADVFTISEGRQITMHNQKHGESSGSFVIENIEHYPDKRWYTYHIKCIVDTPVGYETVTAEFNLKYDENPYRMLVWAGHVDREYDMRAGYYDKQ